MESPGNNEGNDSKNTMNWKDSSHKVLMYHIYFYSTISLTVIPQN
jgi:hypothetical protein